MTAIPVHECVADDAGARGGIAEQLGEIDIGDVAVFLGDGPFGGTEFGVQRLGALECAAIGVIEEAGQADGRCDTGRRCVGEQDDV